MLSSSGAGYEARLSDAKEFVQLKPQIQQMSLGSSNRSVGNGWVLFTGVKCGSNEFTQYVCLSCVSKKNQKETLDRQATGAWKCMRVLSCFLWFGASHLPEKMCYFPLV